jgi:UDPglucose 6-dehydrogenase
VAFSIAVVGCGFVGLSLAVVSANKGIQVNAVDIDTVKIENLKLGIVPFFEPKLKKMIESSGKNLVFSDDLEKSILQSDIIFVTVGTPQNEDGGINLSFIETVCKTIGKSLKNSTENKIIVIKSTVVPGTTNHLCGILESEMGQKLGKTNFVAVNPEFLREGTAIEDTQNPHLIVIGTKYEKAKHVLEEFYKELCSKNIPKTIFCNESTAELIKYTNNAFLATKISFINNISNLCQKIPGADVNLVAEAIGEDKRIGKYFLNAGPGFGGSCLPKDISAFLNYSKKTGVSLSVISAADEINKKQKYVVMELAKELVKDLNGKNVAILGLAFKKDTDDIRNAVSLKIINELLNLHSNVTVHDPMASKNVMHIFDSKINYGDSIKECLKGADLCIVLTEWNEYKKLKPEDFIELMKYPNVIDARRVYDHEQFKNKLNFRAIGLGP